MVKRIEVADDGYEDASLDLADVLSEEAMIRLNVYAGVAMLSPGASPIELAGATQYILVGADGAEATYQEVSANEPLTLEDLEGADAGCVVRLDSKTGAYLRVRHTDGNWRAVAPGGGVWGALEYTSLELVQEAGLTGETWRSAGFYHHHGIKDSDVGFGGETAK